MSFKIIETPHAVCVVCVCHRGTQLGKGKWRLKTSWHAFAKPGVLAGGALPFSPREGAFLQTEQKYLMFDDSGAKAGEGCRGTWGGLSTALGLQGSGDIEDQSTCLTFFQHLTFIKVLRCRRH